MEFEWIACEVLIARHRCPDGDDGHVGDGVQGCGAVIREHYYARFDAAGVCEGFVGGSGDL